MIVSRGFCISLARKKLFFLRTLEMSELCHHTLYPQNKAVSRLSVSESQTDHCQNSHTAVWVSQERMWKVRQWSSEDLCYFQGWGDEWGQPEGNWLPEGTFPKEGWEIEQIKKNPYFCVYRYLVMHAINLPRGSPCHGSRLVPHGSRLTGWCWLRTDPGLLWTVNSLGYQQKQVSSSPSPSALPSKHYRKNGRKSRMPQVLDQGSYQEGRFQWLEHSGRAVITGNIGSYLAWWLFFFPPSFSFFPSLNYCKGLWDHSWSPFHHCFFEVTLAID